MRAEEVERSLGVEASEAALALYLFDVGTERPSTLRLCCGATFGLGLAALLHRRKKCGTVGHEALHRRLAPLLGLVCPRSDVAFALGALGRSRFHRALDLLLVLCLDCESERRRIGTVCSGTVGGGERELRLRRGQA